MHDLERDGYALADILLAGHQCEHIASSLPGVISAARGGARNLISHPTVARLLHHERLGGYLWSLTGRDLVAVKVALFDNTSDENGAVEWHQDRTISVKERMEVAGYGRWSTRAGVLYVDPPSEVLAQMLSIRVYLDECGTDNGPMLAIPGSHESGKLEADQLAVVVAAGQSVELCAPRGAILLMRPLLVHSSSPALAPEHRRVLHIAFAPREAISPLQWHSAVPLRRAA